MCGKKKIRKKKYKDRKSNVFIIGPVIELEKLPVHGSLVRPVVEPWLNRDVINVQFINY